MLGVMLLYGMPLLAPPPVVTLPGPALGAPPMRQPGVGLPGPPALRLSTPPRSRALPSPSPTPGPAPLAAASDDGERAEEARRPEDDQADEREAQARERQRVIPIHRAFGVSTWVAMTLTLVYGALHLRDEYGPWRGEADTPCARGNPVLGQSFCGDNVVWPHAIAASVTTILYFSTFTLSFFLPDPYGLAEQNSSFGRRLRAHKALRWVHFSALLAQILLGAVVANTLADDFGTRQVLANVHMGLGIVTWGTLTAAGALLAF